MDSEDELHSADELNSEAELEYTGALVTFTSALIVLGGAQQQWGVGRGNEALYAIYGGDNVVGDESVGASDPIQDNVSINLSGDEEEDEATPQPHVSDNFARQPSSAAIKRRRESATSSQGPSEEVYIRIVGALEELSNLFKDKVHRTNAFEAALNELPALGLDEVHQNTVVTLLTSNKGYEKGFMFTPKDKRVGFVIGLLQSSGLL